MRDPAERNVSFGKSSRRVGRRREDRGVSLEMRSRKKRRRIEIIVGPTNGNASVWMVEQRSGKRNVRSRRKRRHCRKKKAPGLVVRLRKRRKKRKKNIECQARININSQIHTHTW